MARYADDESGDDDKGSPEREPAAHISFYGKDASGVNAALRLYRDVINT